MNENNETIVEETKTLETAAENEKNESGGKSGWGKRNVTRRFLIIALAVTVIINGALSAGALALANKPAKAEKHNKQITDDISKNENNSQNNDQNSGNNSRNNDPNNDLFGGYGDQYSNGLGDQYNNGFGGGYDDQYSNPFGSYGDQYSNGYGDQYSDPFGSYGDQYSNGYGGQYNDQYSDPFGSYGDQYNNGNSSQYDSQYNDSYGSLGGDNSSDVQNNSGNQSSRASIGIVITENSGVYVTQVTGNNAKQAGFAEGDKIVSIDGKSISSSSDLISEVQSHKAGDTVTVVVERDGQSIEIKTTLE